MQRHLFVEIQTIHLRVVVTTGYYCTTSPIARALALYGLFRFRKEFEGFVGGVRGIESAIDTLARKIDKGNELWLSHWSKEIGKDYYKNDGLRSFDGLANLNFNRLFEFGNPLANNKKIIDCFLEVKEKVAVAA